mmetsp:Transcript_42748/g.129905  ORF Transcript_42748/g.129905 Transcript_42748/m.129905 type:complete len:212 (-) Transcript_42748:194-829(-)
MKSRISASRRRRRRRRRRRPPLRLRLRLPLRSFGSIPGGGGAPPASFVPARCVGRGASSPRFRRRFHFRRRRRRVGGRRRRIDGPYLADDTFPPPPTGGADEGVPRCHLRPPRTGHRRNRNRRRRRRRPSKAAAARAEPDPTTSERRRPTPNSYRIAQSIPEAARYFRGVTLRSPFLGWIPKGIRTIPTCAWRGDAWVRECRTRMRSCGPS